MGTFADDDMIEGPEDETEGFVPEPDADTDPARQPPAGDGGGDGSGDSDDDLPDKFKKRLSRLRQRRREAEERSALAESSNANLRTENEQLRRQLAESRGQHAETSAFAIEKDIEGIKRQLREAKENGDTEKEIELTEKLADARWALNHAKHAQPRKAPGGGDPGDGRPARQPPSPQSAEPPDKERLYAGMHPRAQVWARGLRLLERDPATIGIVVAVEGALANSGQFDSGSDAYYEELNRRLKTRAPELFEDDDLDDEEDDAADQGTGPVGGKPQGKAPVPPAGQSRQRQVHSPVAAPGRDAVPAGAGEGGRRVQLTKEDRANMSRFGLDPTNPKHLAAYAKQLGQE